MSELNPCEAIEILEDIYPSKKQIVTGEYPEVAEALDMAIAALRHAQPANEPLTIEQLREMDGEPVWVISKDFSGIKCGIISKGFIRFLTGERLCVASMVGCGRWMAYRRKPEGSENE